MSTIRAWRILHNDNGDGALLVYAASRNRARALAYKRGPWEYESYLSTQARRWQSHDGAFDCECIIVTNDELPDGCPPFYNDDDWEDGFDC